MTAIHKQQGNQLPPEEGLDPANWDELRTLGHRMIDDLIEFHSSISTAPAWQPLSAQQKSNLQADFPESGRSLDSVYADFTRDIRPYYFGSVHPRSWGWVNGSGTTIGALAELWGAAMNSNVWGGEHAATYVEAGVIAWLRKIMGFPQSASGILLSGASEANLVALAVAREAASNKIVGRLGLQAVSTPLVMYASEQVHNSVDKAVGLLGLGWESLRKVPTDRKFRLDVSRLASMIEHDRAAGRLPACVVATAGTVNTGAIDPLPEIRQLCDREKMWMHVDGAFGAIAVLSPRASKLVRGLELADSLAFDLHKWLHVPIEAACVLIRHSELHKHTFSPAAAYLTLFDTGPASGSMNYSTLGPQLTRSFRALKVWFMLQTFGTAVYGRLVDQNLRQAQYLSDRIDQAPELELLAPPSLGVVCFRYIGCDVIEDGLDSINQDLLIELQVSGEAVPSSTVMGGKFALRVALTNHRTRTMDLDGFIDAVIRIGNAMSS